MKNKASSLGNIPKDIRPRERLKEYGEKSLSNHELLAILLRTGTQKENVLALSLRVLQYFDNLTQLKQASLEELQQVEGIGPAKAMALRAAIELGMRICESKVPKYGNVSSTVTAGTWLIREMSGLQQEHLIVLFLNSKNEIIKKSTIFIGTVNSSVAHPREIFKEAVKYPTNGIILAHNHPSGDTSPSQADLTFTKRMIECGDLMGIHVVDHLIIGHQTYNSLRESTNIFK